MISPEARSTRTGAKDSSRRSTSGSLSVTSTPENLRAAVRGSAARTGGPNPRGRGGGAPRRAEPAGEVRGDIRERLVAVDELAAGPGEGGGGVGDFQHLG